MPEESRRYYLGRVRSTPRVSFGNYRYTNVEPVIESDPDGHKWSGPIHGPLVRFPTRGWVHWHRCPPQLEVGGLWQFRVDEHPDVDQRDRHEHFQLLDAIVPIEVIDLRSVRDTRELQDKATTSGMSLSHDPLGRRVMLWMSDGELVGPVQLKRSGDSNRWILDISDPSRLSVHATPEEAINSVRFDGERLFISPPHHLGPVVGVQNWAPNGQVARSILKRLRHLNRDVADALKISEGVFKSYIDTIEQAGFLQKDGALERARIERLQSLRASLKEDAELLAEAAEVFVANDAVRNAVKARTEAEYERLLSEKRKELDAELAKRLEELKMLTASVADRTARVSELNAGISQKETELEERVATFDTAFQQRLRNLVRFPQEVFGELAMLRAVLTENSASGVPPAAPRPILSGDATPQTLLKDQSAVLTALGKHSVSFRIAPLSVIDLHAAFLSGAMPIVLGQRAYDALNAYARSVAGGRRLWIPVGSSLLEPQDILGRLSSGSRFIPHAGGLLDLILEARDSESLYLVVLEGFNRAPVESYLLPLLETAKAARVRDERRAIPLATRALSAEDPYRSVSTVQLPRNVLIAALPSFGNSVLPVPLDIWRYAVLLDADGDGVHPTESFDGSARRNLEEEMSAVNIGLWDQMRDAANTCDATDAMTTAASLRTSLSADCQGPEVVRFMYCVLRSAGFGHDDALRRTIARTLVPASAADEEAVEAALRGAGLENAPQWRSLLASAGRLQS